MSLISFVVPVYQVQGYLRQCLDSILNQSFTDLDVIAVDDCSPDGCGEVLAEYAARDPRLRVITLPRNSGQGPARNRGLAVATGDYVWFVDSDDWLADGAVRAVVQRLRETDADVLIVDHAKVRWDSVATATGSSVTRPNPTGPRAAGSAVTGPRATESNASTRRFGCAPWVFTLDEWPEAIEILHVPWNKVVRRQLLLDLNFQFPPGWYEDVPFTYRLLPAAERITVLDRVCVYYRQRRSGAATCTAGDGHFAIFVNWAEVFETFDGTGREAQRLRQLLFRRMLRHLLWVRGNDQRMPKHLRRRFFAAMTAQYHRYLPSGGYRRPPGVEGVKHRLVAHGRRRTFEALRIGFRTVGLLRELGRSAARYGLEYAGLAARALRRAVGVGYYLAQLRLPVDERLAVYAAYWYRGYACNPAAIYESARELAPHVRGVWVVRRDRVQAMPPGVDHVVAGSLRYYRTLARAKWLFNNVNWPGWLPKRPGSVHVMTHHGTPLKVMGADQLSYPAAARDADVDGQLRRADRWDFSITANPFTTQMWERAYPCGYRTLEFGFPRNDRLVTATDRDVARARALLGISPEDRVVLYAPTHRDHHPGYHPPFDVGEFVGTLGATGRLLVRGHYLQDRAHTPGSRWEADRVRDVSAYPCIEELYLAADVLVTDYSSAMFDYAILDRPIVIYAPDWQAYRLLRGVYFDITAEPPGAVAMSFPDLLDLFRTGAYDDDAATKARGGFRRRFCALQDGRAAERVVRAVLLAGSSSPAKVASTSAAAI